MLSNHPYNVVNKVPMSVWEAFGAKVHLIQTKEEWDAFFELLMQQELVACDTETSGFDYFKDAHIVGLSFGWKDLHFYIPVRHEDSVLSGAQPTQLDIKDILDDLKKFFRQTDVFTVFHNFKFDSHFITKEGVEIKTPFHDTRILWQLYDENAPGKLKVIASGWTDILGRRHRGLVDPQAGAAEKRIDKWRADEARARRKAFSALVMAEADRLQKDPAYQSYNRRDLKKHIASTLLKDHKYANATKDDVHYGFVPIPMMCEYAGLDTFFTWTIYTKTMKGMSLSKSALKLYLNELSLSKALGSAEDVGVQIDRDYLVQLEKSNDQKVLALTKELEGILGEGINFNSPQQLSQALFAAGVPLVKKTDSAQKCSGCVAGNCTSHFQVDAKVLNKLKNYAVVDKILELRTVEKLNGTYVRGIQDKLTKDSVLHCSFNQNVKTGRMSSQNPNLQNIPGRDTSIRRAFVCPDDDHIYVFLDYSQVEVRLTAHYSKDPLLLQAYATGRDIHTATMCSMFHLDYDEVAAVIEQKDKAHPKWAEWSLYRQVGKVLNFGVIYGVSAIGLSEQIPRPPEHENLPQKEWVRVCEAFIDKYFDTYLEVSRFINRSQREIGKRGEATNHFGRVRHLPHARATKILGDPKAGWMESRAKRQGVNFLVQGTAADLFKFAVVRVHNILKGKKSRIVNFVHDEIQIYMHKSEVDLLPQIKEAMEDFPDFVVPIVADVEYTTTNWAEKRNLDVYNLPENF